MNDNNRSRNPDIRLSGFLLGLCAGTLAGFSVSPVVGTVVSSLLTAGFLLLSIAPSSDKIDLGQVNTTAISLFVVGLLVGSLSGSYARTHHLLLPSPIEMQFSQLTSVGFSDDDARSIISASMLDGGGLGQSSGLSGGIQMSDFQLSELKRLIALNYALQFEIPTMPLNEQETIRDTIVRFTNSQTGAIALVLREIIEKQAGAPAAEAFHELHTTKPELYAAAEARIRTENPEAVRALEEYFEDQ